ncbi:MAG: hypothetical protein NC110_07450, partial [Ruminococcus sp.]|nr:hypothetical protein [Ruminococcus sp.]
MIVDLLGTEYKFRFSFAAVVTIMLLTANSKIAAISLVSSLFHECGHLVFMFAFGEKPSRVELGAFGIRIERLGASTISYQKEAVIAIGGVCVNFLIALLCLAVYLIFGSETALMTVFINIFIASLNLMPVGMLDAGRFLRYILSMQSDEEKTEKLLNCISNITVICFTAFCVLYTAASGVNISLIAVAVYLI